MLVLIIVGILSVFFAYLAQFNKFKFGLKLSFLLIFLFLALRYDFGNDYDAYLEKFQFLEKYGLEAFLNNDESEKGWVYLNILFLPFGFFVLVAFLALINCLVYYDFIKRFVPVKLYWLSVFIYMFDPYLMLIHSSAMRQSLAISLVVFSIKYLYEKKLFTFFLIVLLASYFHSSALIALVLIPLLIFNFKISLKFGLIFCTLFLLLFFASDLINNNVGNFLQLYLSRYETHLENDVVLKQEIGLGVVLQFMILIIVIYYGKFQNKESSLLFKIYIISFIFIPLSMIIWLIDRTGFYFTIFSIAVIPIIASSMVNRNIAKFVPIVFIAFTLFKFYLFFQSEIWIKSFETYHTIIPKLIFLSN